MLPKLRTHSPEVTVNGPLLPRGVNVLATLMKALHFFVLLEVSAVRSGEGNQQPCLTVNGAVALHSSASYSVGTG